MENIPRHRTWISVLGIGEEVKAGLANGGGSALRSVSEASPTRSMPPEARGINRRPLKGKCVVSGEECQRAFNEVRKLHPDALYEDLSEIAAKHLNLTARQLRKHVPNPFT